MLEQIAYEVQRVSEERQTTYFTVGDLESLSAVGLYTNEKIVDLKALGIQMHIHEDKDGKITGAGLKIYGEEKIFKKLSNYEATMGDAFAQGLDLTRIDTIKEKSSTKTISTGGFNGFTMNTGSSY